MYPLDPPLNGPDCPPPPPPPPLINRLAFLKTAALEHNFYFLCFVETASAELCPLFAIHMEIAFVSNTTSNETSSTAFFFVFELVKRHETVTQHLHSYLMCNRILEFRSMSARCKVLVDEVDCSTKRFCNLQN